MGQQGGTESVLLSQSNLPPHTHPITDVSHSHTYERTNTTNFGPSLVGQSGGTNNSTVSTSSAFTGITTTQVNVTTYQPINLLNPFTALNYIIKL
jgi:microcystin-dependent protein